MLQISTREATDSNPSQEADYSELVLLVMQQNSNIRISWDGEPSGYAENQDNRIFL
jgi:hypothetical protein